MIMQEWLLQNYLWNRPVENLYGITLYFRKIVGEVNAPLEQFLSKYDYGNINVLTY